MFLPINNAEGTAAELRMIRRNSSGGLQTFPLPRLALWLDEEVFREKV
jgi:hypothetical protein